MRERASRLIRRWRLRRPHLPTSSSPKAVLQGRVAVASTTTASLYQGEVDANLARPMMVLLMFDTAPFATVGAPLGHIVAA